MTVLAALLALAVGPGDLPADLDLPLSLSEAEPQDKPAEKKVEPTLRAGGRLGYWEGGDGGDGGFTIGIFVRYHFNEMFSFEASLDFHKEEYGSVDVTVIPLLATALFHPFRFDNVKPYALAGIGLYHVFADGGGVDDNDIEFGAHLGVGTEVHLGGLMLDGQLRFGFVDSGFGDDLDYWAFLVGVGFKLGS